MRMPDAPPDEAGSGEARRAALLLGLAQTIAWAGSYYLPAVLAPVVVADLGADPALVYGAFSVALLFSGLAAPSVGRAVERHGGRPVLALSAVVIAAGLVLLWLLPGIEGWICGWVVLGFGMSMGLYEAAFATLGELYGRAARRPITIVTLVAGFASTVGWPLTSALLPELGWRGTCLAYAGVCLGLLLPLYLLLPRGGSGGATGDRARRPCAAEDGEPALPAAWLRRSFLLMAAFFTLRALIATTMSTHLITLMGGLGLAAAAAVGAASLMGPAQVGGRMLEFAFGGGVHPLAVARLGAVLLPLGAALLLLAGPAAAVPFVLLYGASNGIVTISRGAVPLALFGARGYPVLMGRLALPVLLAQAAAPTVTAPLVASLPAMAVLGLTGGVAALALLCLLPLRAPLHPVPSAVPGR